MTRTVSGTAVLEVVMTLSHTILYRCRERERDRETRTQRKMRNSSLTWPPVQEWWGQFHARQCWKQRRPCRRPPCTCPGSWCLCWRLGHLSLSHLADSTKRPLLACNKRCVAGCHILLFLGGVSPHQYTICVSGTNLLSFTSCQIAATYVNLHLPGSQNPAPKQPKMSSTYT